MGLGDGIICDSLNTHVHSRQLVRSSRETFNQGVRCYDSDGDGGHVN